jgi:hypothetical protein
MLVTAMCPTRGRTRMLEESLITLTSKCHVPTRLEILIRCDDDDIDTQHWLRSRTELFSRAIVGPRGGGYADLHNMYDHMCQEAKGKYLMMWNDDALMLTQNWDDEIVLHGDRDDRPLYLDTRVMNGMIEHQYTFPIIHRSYYEILGRYSQSAHSDTYIYEVLQPFFNQVYRQTNICIQHRFDENVSKNDRTYLEGKQTHPETKRPWKNGSIIQTLARDRAKIAARLSQTNQ